MNARELLRRFPNCSRATLQANCGDADPNANRASKALPEAEVSYPESPEQTGALDADSEGKAQGTGRPHVCFTLRRVRLLDWDAKYSSVKDALDGLAYAGLIPGDREDQITGEVRQEKVKKYDQEETIIEITYP